MKFSQFSISFAFLRCGIQLSFWAYNITMSLFNFSLKICCFLPAFALSLALSVPSKPDGLLALTQPSRLTVPVNTSVLAESSTIGDILRLPLNAPTIRAGGNVDCDWYRFGNPPAASCKDAVDQIPQDPATMSRNPNLSYGPRGPLSWDVNLPSRYISCKCAVGSSPPTLSGSWALRT